MTQKATTNAIILSILITRLGQMYLGKWQRGIAILLGGIVVGFFWAGGWDGTEYFRQLDITCGK